MNSFRKAVEALERLATNADRLVPLVLSLGSVRKPKKYDFL